MNREPIYPVRVRQMLAALRDQDALGPSDAVSGSVPRRRAMKWLSRAFGHLPRPEMEAMYPDCWLTIIVSRVRELEGELYARLAGVRLDAEPLPEELPFLKQQRRGSRPKAAAEEFLFIPGDWDGEPTLPGDYCIEALEEFLCERNRANVGTLDPRACPPGGTRGQADDVVPVAAGRAPLGEARLASLGLLARGPGEVPCGEADLYR